MGDNAEMGGLTAGSQPVLRELESQGFPAFFQLWTRYFGTSSAEGLRRRWRWQFELNPFVRERAPRHIVLAQGDDVHGYIGALPVPLRLHGERVVALCATGLVVEQSHRMFAARLMRALSAELPVMGTAMSAGARSLFAHCGGKVVPLSRERFVFPLRYNGAACLKLRRRLRTPLVRLIEPWMLGPAGKLVRPRGAPAPRRLPPARDVAADACVVTDFGADYEALWLRVREQFNCSLDKTAEYMNWRYFSGPTAAPICFALRDARGQLSALAIAVLRTRRDWLGQPCATHGELVELIADRPDDPRLPSLVLRVMLELDRRRVDSIAATGLLERYHPLLLSLEFERSDADVFDVALNFGKGEATARLLDASSTWYLAAGDGEALFASAL